MLPFIVAKETLSLVYEEAHQLSLQHQEVAGYDDKALKDLPIDTEHYSILEDNNEGLLITLRDESLTLQGYAFIQFASCPAYQGSKIAAIQLMFINKSFRLKYRGCGDYLLEVCEAIAQENGCSSIEITLPSKRSNSKWKESSNFYLSELTYRKVIDNG